MLFFHGNLTKNNRSFFEGWYFKHRIGDEVFSVIPGIAIDENGGKKAFVQTISNEHSSFIEYSYDEFYASEKELLVVIDNNIFTKKGIWLDINKDNTIIKGNIKYSRFQPLYKNIYAPNIMGPFAYIPFLQCYHDVLSLGHSIKGNIQINGKIKKFNNGFGYLEKDWGRSFPRAWFWIQCNNFKSQNASVMLALATIPFLNTTFDGIIGVCDIENKQYKFATYYGAKIKSIKHIKNKTEITIEQNKYKLEMQVIYKEGFKLSAPVLGQMNREIIEYPACLLNLRFYENNKIILGDIGRNASFEYAQN